MMREAVNIEMPVIGSLLMWYDELKDSINELDESDFIVLRDLFLIIKQEYQAEAVTDKAIILSKIYDGRLAKLAVDCCASVVTVQNYREYVAELKRQAKQRRLHKYLQDMILEEELRTEDFIKIAELENSRGDASAAAEKALKAMQEFCDGVGVKKQRIYTGFSILDKTFGGLRRPSVCYIGARPSTGKTTLALNIASYQQNQTVLIFSLEMSSEMIFERMAASNLHIDYGAIDKQRTTEAENEKIRKYVKDLMQARRLFVIDDTYSVEAMSAAVSSIKPDMVIIDYVQKVTTTLNIVNLRERMEYISGEFKRIAKFNNCCLIALSQISRNGKEAPTMSDLKESGALEADGDYILLIHRPYVLNKGSRDISEHTTEVLVDKNKFGSTGKVDFYFDGQYQQFREIDKRFEGMHMTSEPVPRSFCGNAKEAEQ